MSRHLLTIHSTPDRMRAANYVAKAPLGTRIEFKSAKRTLAQNDRMWAMLTDIAKQKEHCGRKYTPDKWKCLFMHACGQRNEFVPSLDNSTFIPLGHASSDLTKDEMSKMIDLMQSWGAENGVHFNVQAGTPHEPDEPAQIAAKLRGLMPNV